MADKKYKINRSNYTLRTRHQLVKGGSVYERDFMTTTNLGGWDSGSIPHGENNFKMVYRDLDNGRKRIGEENWKTWTASDIETGYTEQKCIKIKPNYHSLLDFAYFGNCRQLLSSTIRKIINTFPGELYVYNKEKFKINGVTYYEVKNNFDIDMFSTTSAKTHVETNNDEANANITKRANAKGHEYEEKGIRSFNDSWRDYVAINGSSIYEISGYTSSGNTGCMYGDKIGEAKITLAGGTKITLYNIVFEEGPVLFTETDTPWHIRPKKEVIDKFFDELDDFERMMLNAGEKPEYTMNIDYPHDTDEGLKTYRRTFTWPKDGDWNLDITSTAYKNYVEELLDVADTYDESYTDNLWRMLTHDSIKNMDMAFANPKKDEDAEDYNIGTTRLEGLMWAIGRQFDEIKRYIGNIKSTTNVTYDECGNVPDYFLSDALELSGWEVYNVDNGLNDTKVNVQWGRGNLSYEKEYTTKDANFDFLRNLKINSKSIFRKKGTRDGIVSLLGLFGMEEGTDYTMTEYVAKVTGNIDQEEFEKLVYKMRGEEQDFSYGIPGFPFARVIVSDNSTYLVPWFSKDEKYDGDTYFQMYGGWGKNLESGYYDETIKYITVVSNAQEMFKLSNVRLYEGSICFVEDISGLDVSQEGDYAHYFILKNTEGSGIIGEDGWQQVSSIDEKKLIDRVEAIVEDFRANNPHVGYGKYDGGREYIERIKRPFRYHLQHKDEPYMFSDLAYECDGKLNSGYTNFSISVETGQTDNKKVWFFGEHLLPDGTKSISKMYNEKEDDEIDIFDFEKNSISSDATEPAANSIINVKLISFTFVTENKYISEFTEFLKSVVLPYLKQMIPSTAIWEWKVKGRETIHVTPDDSSSVDKLNVAIVADWVAFDGNEENDDFIANYDDNKWHKN